MILLYNVRHGTISVFFECIFLSAQHLLFHNYPGETPRNMDWNITLATILLDLMASMALVGLLVTLKGTSMNTM
jgi:hypothetical protein